jgi:hypothetical protein
VHRIVAAADIERNTTRCVAAQPRRQRLSGRLSASTGWSSYPSFAPVEGAKRRQPQSGKFRRLSGCRGGAGRLTSDYSNESGNLGSHPSEHSIHALKLGKYIVRVSLQNLCNLQKLHYIEPPFAILVFRDEGLRPFQPVGQILLGHARRLPRCNKALQKNLILAGMDRFSHAYARRWTEAQAELIPFSDYPKLGFS